MSTLRHRIVVRRRQQLVARDGGERCYYCQERFEFMGNRITVDHLIPESRGGTHALDNLALACFTCNRRKGTMTAEEFRASDYLIERHRVRTARERRERTTTHTAIRFFDKGRWSCSACGSTGPRHVSPTLVACVGATPRYPGVLASR